MESYKEQLFKKQSYKKYVFLKSEIGFQQEAFL